MSSVKMSWRTCTVAVNRSKLQLLYTMDTSRCMVRDDGQRRVRCLGSASRTNTQWISVTYEYVMGQRRTVRSDDKSEIKVAVRDG